MTRIDIVVCGLRATEAAAAAAYKWVGEHLLARLLLLVGLALARPPIRGEKFNELAPQSSGGEAQRRCGTSARSWQPLALANSTPKDASMACHFDESI